MITSLTLASFRAYTNTRLELTPMTLITGVNGSGKTHILEAIHWACGGALSPNLLGDAEYISLSGMTDQIPYTSEIRREDRSTSYFFQGKKYSRTKYLESLPVRSVIFSPFDMHLPYLAPSLRRDALDSILDRSFAQFHTTKRQYDQVLRQRNALLKAIQEGNASAGDLDFWDEKFATLADTYTLYRNRYREAILEQSAMITSHLPDYTLQFRYITKYDLQNVKASILAYLAEKRTRDILSGHTHIGPHLDDYTWEILIGENAFPVSEYLSRGENKILLLGMKMVEIDFLEKITGKEIILLFDDMFSELDNTHSEELLKGFRMKQICITAQHIPSFLRSSDDFTCIETENL